MSPSKKAEYFKSIFHDVNSCILFCDKMIATCVLDSSKEYYQKVKQKLQED